MKELNKLKKIGDEIPVVYMYDSLAETSVVEIDELKNLVLKSIIINDNNTQLKMITEDEATYTFYHNQDCCEEVYIADIIGDLKDLIGSPLLCVECVTSDMSEDEQEATNKSHGGIGLWTFYKFATRKGYVDIRWCGMSNGYYSVEVSLGKD
jgi:hypothetical protein